MPLYEYVCTDCNARFETLMPTPAAADSAVCPSHVDHQVRRLVSSFARGGGRDEAPLPMRSSGGCCGGSCGCGGHA